eukprot:TRINITY_DN10603_c0_g1_i2.p1 TRINITY_DN10603_c0_g1~~TRINITY_DN10603_c0_g1_i2.p1  ORF type:complete len:265 (+),score=30.91 TRINITY_DN10603_c0_g1_i2:101-895(+)
MPNLIAWCVRTATDDSEGSVRLLAATVSFLYSIYTFLLWGPRIEQSEAKIVLGIFHFLFANLVLSLCACANLDPGYVPADQAPTAQRRYCEICKSWKPDRAHHCKTCRRCVLNMDHHCPWVDNCIGFKNRRFFLMSLCYGCAILAFIVATTYREVGEHCLRIFTAWQSACIVAMFASCGLMLLRLGFFTWLHLQLVLENKTTIEALEDSEIRSAFNIGCYRNITQVFGAIPLFWCFPIPFPCLQPVGDGVNWERGRQSSRYLME